MCRPLLALLPGSTADAAQTRGHKEPADGSSCGSYYSDVDYSSDDYEDSCLDELLQGSSGWQSRCEETADIKAAAPRFAASKPLPLPRLTTSPVLQAEAFADDDAAASEEAVMAIITAALEHQQLNADNNSCSAAATAAAGATQVGSDLQGILNMPIPLELFSHPPVHRCLFDSNSAPSSDAGDAADYATHQEELLYTHTISGANGSGNSSSTEAAVSRLPNISIQIDSPRGGSSADSGDQVQQWLASLEAQALRKRAFGGSGSGGYDSAAAAADGDSASGACDACDRPSRARHSLGQGLPPPAFMLLGLLG